MAVEDIYLFLCIIILPHAIQAPRSRDWSLLNKDWSLLNKGCFASTEETTYPTVQRSPNRWNHGLSQENLIGEIKSFPNPTNGDFFTRTALGSSHKIERIKVFKPKKFNSSKASNQQITWKYPQISAIGQQFEHSGLNSPNEAVFSSSGGEI